MDLTLTIKADETPLRAALARLISLLRSRDLSPELRDNMLDTLGRALAQPERGSVYEVTTGHTAAPGEIRVEVRPGKLILNAIAALRGLPEAA